MSGRVLFGGLLAAALPLLLACGAEEPPRGGRSLDRAAWASVRGRETRAKPRPPAAASSPLRVVVMDPLCAQLACDCVAGYAQRKYDRLGEFLERKLARQVEIAYAEALSSPHAGAKQGIDLVIGKFSAVVFDAERAGLKIRTIAMLTDKEGSVTQTGLFVVRQADPARSRT